MHFYLRTLARWCSDFYGGILHRPKGGLILGCLLTLAALTSSTVIGTALCEQRVARARRQMAASYQSATQAFSAAEAGLEEARARLRFSTKAQQMVTTDDPGWRATLYVHDVPALDAEALVSVQEDLHYTVHIAYAVTPGDKRVLRWGDDHGDGVNTRNPHTGEILYRLTSEGFDGDARRTITAEMARVPPLTVPGALYMGGPGVIQGHQTAISGIDSCGTGKQAGIRTPLAAGAIVLSDPPASAATPSRPEIAVIRGLPAIAYDSRLLNIRAMIDLFKEQADVVYSMIPDPRSAGIAPYPGSQWGIPRRGIDLLSPSVCTEQRIVYYKTQEQGGLLRDGVSGCGLLLVDGDLEIRGDFHWYGVVLVAGALRLHGGGMKHFTGGLLVADSVMIEAPTTMLYCSEAIQQQTRTMPLRVVRWQEIGAAQRTDNTVRNPSESLCSMLSCPRGE